MLGCSAHAGEERLASELELSSVSLSPVPLAAGKLGLLVHAGW